MWKITPAGCPPTASNSGGSRCVSDAELHALFEALTDLVLVLDSQGRYLKVAPTAPGVLYWPPEELLGKTVHEVFRTQEADFFLAHIQQALEENRSHGIEYPLAIGDREVWFEGSVTPLGDAAVLWVARDITERKRTEEQLHQARKMEAIGQLAGGIAHDFNNLLTVINGYADLLVARQAPGESPEKEMRAICKAGQQAASLTRRLLAFSRRQILQPVKVNLDAAVLDIQPIVRRLLPENIDIAFHLDAGNGHTKVDPTQLEQVVINLAVNARDAMPLGGKLTIETAIVELDEPYASAHAEVRPGRYVLLAMTDTGIGMSAATRVRIFEPYFTTKTGEAGTGLGLAMVHGVIRQSDGYIWVYSEPGAGTTFKIYLPLAEAPRPYDLSRPSNPVPLPGGDETVLLVEDDDAVREYVAETLAVLGYEVIQAANGRDAASKSAAFEGRIALLITDVVMPGGSGRSIASQLLLDRPDLQVLYISGYTDDAIVRHGILEPGVAFLAKPFSADTLARKVRDVLDNRRELPVVLVVDDDLSVRNLLCDVLKHAGYAAVEASNGLQALRLCEETRVDLVITDLAMPDREGIETIQALRLGFRGVPIIAMSGMFEADNLLRIAQHLGAAKVFQKPLDLEKIRSAVHDLLSARKVPPTDRTDRF